MDVHGCKSRESSRCAGTVWLRNATCVQGVTEAGAVGLACGFLLEGW